MPSFSLSLFLSLSLPLADFWHRCIHCLKLVSVMSGEKLKTKKKMGKVVVVVEEEKEKESRRRGPLISSHFN